MGTAVFSKHCHDFAQKRGASIIEVGSGLIGALIKYMNAVHGQHIENPFHKLAAAGLMPDSAQPREQRLQHHRVKDWYAAVQRLPDKQRDLLMLLALTGLRRNEGGMLRRSQLDLVAKVPHIPETKTGQPPLLPYSGTVGSWWTGQTFNVIRTMDVGRLRL